VLTTVFSTSPSFARAIGLLDPRPMPSCFLHCLFSFFYRRLPPSACSDASAFSAAASAVFSSLPSPSLLLSPSMSVPAKLGIFDSTWIWIAAQ
jgi:hypothetical protein